MQWDEEGGHVFHDKPKAYTNPRGQVGSRGPAVAGMWLGHQEGDAEMLQACGTGERVGGVPLCHKKTHSFVSQRWQRHTALLQGEDAIWHKNPPGQGWRSGEKGGYTSSVTVGFQICSFPYMRVPGEQLLCFQPALAISAPTCAWGPLWPPATPVLLHSSRAPWALSHLLSNEL